MRYLFLSFASVLFAIEQSWERYKEDTISRDLPLIPGWCTKEKADVLMDFIYDTHPLLCVEIGAFAGSTTYPIARAISFLKQGVVYAIDTWEPYAFLEGLEIGDPHIAWWNGLHVDMSSAHQYLTALLHQRHLDDCCHLLKMRSDQAVSLFVDRSIDFLYLDGNLSTTGSLRDVSLYFPKVKEGGFIWLNLADLPTKSESLAFLLKRTELLQEKSIGTHCLLFKK